MRDLEIHPDASSLYQAAARHVVEIARRSVAEHGAFFVALAGGSTPRELYLLLAEAPWRSMAPWDRTQVFFGDERCVAPDHPESNYRMAREALLDKLALPATHIHRMLGELEPNAAASAYQEEIRRAFAIDAEQAPGFDLILLGLGPDGHTASLFPDSAALREDRKWVVANYVAKLDSFRLTLTLPALNHAREVMFLVSGGSKAEVVHHIFETPERHFKYPAELVQPKLGRLRWLLDRAAASRLQPHTTSPSKG